MAMLLEAVDSKVLLLAETLHTTESAIRLIGSLVAGIPLALVHRQFFYGRSPTIQHSYFTTCGLAICMFNFGWSAFHSLTNIVLMYIMLLFTSGTLASVVAAFVINMTYLILAYWCTATDKYDIKWSTPHCVITLRLIGLAFDLYDGKRKTADLSDEQKETALKTKPSLLEMCGFVYYFGGFLTGPQFSVRRYLDFVNGAFSDPDTGGKPKSVLIGLQRSLLGGLCIAVFQISDIFLPTTYMISDEFAVAPYWRRLFFVMMWGKFHLYKYIGVWLITEGACIMTGLTYNGKDERGQAKWDACANVKLRKFEVCVSFQDLIDSFNVNTNKWMAKYIYKRCKFLGSREASQNITMFFLAIWHGLASGYFNNFFLEFVIVKLEKDIRHLVYGNPTLSSICEMTPIRQILFIIKKAYVNLFLGYPLASFVLLTFDRWWKFYTSMYFIGHIIFCSWPLVHILIRPLFKVSKSTENNRTQNGPVREKQS